MKAIKAEDIVKITKGFFSGPDNIFIKGISTDTRTIKEGELFVPLKGENFDGHHFIKKAFAKGAVLSLCNKKEKPAILQNSNIIFVRDTREALLEFAKYYRGLFKIPFIAITGSVGKTTTKELVSKVLGKRYSVLKTEGNLNNEIGLPLTIFNLDDSHDLGVVEIGMSDFGEISRLSDVVRPHIGVITNVGVSHIEKLKSKMNIAKAKLEIVDGMKNDDILLLNADTEELWEKRHTLKTKVIYFGTKRGDIKASNLVSLGKQGIIFDVVGKYGNFSCKVSLPGLHNVYNALVAIAIGLEMGISKEDICESLLEIKPPCQRLEFKKALSGALVVDDTYNASPDSVKASLNILSDLDNSGKKVAILGDMLELGKYSQDAHKDVGKYAASKVDKLVTIGRYSEKMAEGAIEGNLNEDDIFIYYTVDEAMEQIEKIVKDCNIILIKASRALELERVTKLLTRGS